MPTATLESAPDHAEQPTRPPAPELAKPAVLDATKAATADSAKPAWVRQHRIAIIIAGIVLIAVAIVIWKAFFAVPAVPASIVVVSGRIEGDDSAVASKTSGRILGSSRARGRQRQCRRRDRHARRCADPGARGRRPEQR